ncbi:MAG: hypothetical protein WCG92_14300 [Hyphomicrobiales bacterium]
MAASPPCEPPVQVADWLWGSIVRIRCPRFLAVIGLVLTLPLAGCMRDPYVSTTSFVQSGSWQVDRTADRVTGVPISSAGVKTTASNTDEPYPRPASMQLLCFINKPVVSFRFEFKMGIESGSFLGYRFDDKPGHETNARFMAAARTVVIEDDAEVAQFVGELATSNMLYIRIRSFSAGRTTAEFKVDGAPAAIAAAYATCPVKQPEPQRVATRSPSKRLR